MRKGETKNILPLSAVTLRPFSQKTCIVFERLADIFLRFVQRNTFRNKLANPVASEYNPFLLIRLFFCHNISNLIVVDFAGFICSTNTNCLSMRWKHIGFIYTVNNISLSFLIKIGELHGGTHFHLTFIHKVLQLRYKVGKADIALYLCIAIFRVLSKYFSRCLSI